MSRAAVGTSDGGDDARPDLHDSPTLGVEIHFYRPDQPITIPLPDFDQVKAQSYLDRLKSDVIEAQLHSDPRISIDPVVRGQEVLVLDPMTIKQVVLVDGTARDEPTTDELPNPYVAGIANDSGSDPRAAGTQLTADQQRRIAIILE